MADRSDLARPSASFVRRRSTLALAVGLTGELRRSSSPAGRHTVRAAALRRAPHRALGDSGTVERAEARRARAPPTLLSGEIADELTVAVNTAKSHVRSIDRKLGISTRRDAVRMAQERRLLTPRTATHVSILADEEVRGLCGHVVTMRAVEAAVAIVAQAYRRDDVFVLTVVLDVVIIAAVLNAAVVQTSAVVQPSLTASIAGRLDQC